MRKTPLSPGHHVESQWKEIKPEKKEVFLNMKCCSLDGIVPKDLKGAHAGNVPVFMENSLQRKDSWSIREFLVRVYFLSTWPNRVPKSPSPSQSTLSHLFAQSLNWTLEDFSQCPCFGQIVDLIFFSTRHLSNSVENYQHTHDIVWVPLKICSNLGNFRRNQEQQLKSGCRKGSIWCVVSPSGLCTPPEKRLDGSKSQG